jgi:purine-binding chemotaxis protein CheW
LRKKVGLQNIEKDERTRIIVFYVAEKLVGMIVDQVDRVVRLRQDQIEPPPDIGLGKIQEFVSGVGKIENGLFILLNTEKLLTDEEILPIEEMRRIREAVMPETAVDTPDGRD